MPYCPQCGAEYTAGITTCRECGVPLVAGPLDRVRARPFHLAAFLRVPLSQFARGLGYAAQAAHLLWRTPALLALPLLVVLFNNGESMLGSYLADTATAAGRAHQAAARQRTPWPLPSLGFMLGSAPAHAADSALDDFR